MRRLLVVLACTGLAACSSSSNTPSAPAAGDKAVCGAFQVLADALVDRDATRARTALSGLKQVAGTATTKALKADATGLASATDGATASGFGQRIVVDCKGAGHPLRTPSASPTP